MSNNDLRKPSGSTVGPGRTHGLKVKNLWLHGLKDSSDDWKRSGTRRQSHQTFWRTKTNGFSPATCQDSPEENLGVEFELRRTTAVIIARCPGKASTPRSRTTVAQRIFTNEELDRVGSLYVLLHNVPWERFFKVPTIPPATS